MFSCINTPKKGANSMEVIKTAALTKAYGAKRAVDHLDMTVRQGDIYGFIGRNGSGKSTTMKMLCGLATPTEGEVRLFGKPVDDPAARRRVGALVESAGLYGDCSAHENLMLKATCMGLVDGDRQCRDLLGLVGLEGSSKQHVKKFSMGMKQRLGVALALLGSPDLLLLDEPINGLDPEGIQEIRQLLLRLNRENGITLLVSSHILGELSKIATCYGILKDGRLVEQLTAEELQARCRDYLHLRVADAKTAAVLLEQELGVHQYEVRPEGEIRVYDAVDAARVTAVLSAHGVAVAEIYLHGQDLEGYFLELMGGADHV